MVFHFSPCFIFTPVDLTVMNPVAQSKMPPPLVEKNRVEWCPPYFRAIRNGTEIEAYIMNIGGADFKIDKRCVTAKSPLGTEEPLKEELTLFAIGCRDCLKVGVKRQHQGCTANLPFPVCYGCSRLGYAKSVCISPNCQKKQSWK